MNKPASSKALLGILSMLDTLDENDLKKLSFALSQKLGGSAIGLPKANTAGGANLNVFYKAVVKALPDEVLWPDHVAILKKSSKSTYSFITSAFEKVEKAADELVSKSNTQVSKQVLRQKIYNLFAVVVVQWLEENNIAVSMRQVLSQSNRFLALLDDSFPGYLQTGNIDLILDPKQ